MPQLALLHPTSENGYVCACRYTSDEYYLAFNATASAVRQAFPDVVIHASSWSGQYYSANISSDAHSLGLVDVWTFHEVGSSSDEQVERAEWLTSNTNGRPVASNEYEYLSGFATAWRTVNTAQSIMNWLVFEDAPVWYWLHALKPVGHAEAATYSLGYWQPWVPADEGIPGVDDDGPAPPNIPPGTWTFNPPNWNAVAGFVRYMPWDCVRVYVVEDTVRLDQRVLAFLSDSASPHRSARVSGRQSLRSRATVPIGDSTTLTFVLSNRNATEEFPCTVEIAGAGTPVPLVFTGHLFSHNTTDASLGTVQAKYNPATGLHTVATSVPPLSIVFWVQDV